MFTASTICCLCLSRYSCSSYSEVGSSGGRKKERLTEAVCTEQDSVFEHQCSSAEESLGWVHAPARRRFLHLGPKKAQNTHGRPLELDFRF